MIGVLFVGSVIGFIVVGVWAHVALMQSKQNFAELIALRKHVEKLEGRIEQLETPGEVDPFTGQPVGL